MFNTRGVEQNTTAQSGGRVMLIHHTFQHNVAKVGTRQRQHGYRRSIEEGHLYWIRKLEQGFLEEVMLEQNLEG